MSATVIWPSARRARLVFICALSAVLAGCATLRPEAIDAEALPALPERFSAAGERPLPDRWWQHFDDTRLDALIERSLSDNFSLQAVRERLRQAQAAAGAARAEQRPSVNASGGVSRRRDDGGEGRSAWSVGAAASYELDLWGRLESSAEAARLDAEASRAQLEAAAISLTAETANGYYALLEQRGTVALLRTQLQTNDQVLELVELRFRNGRASADEVLRQRQLIEQTQSGLVTAQAESQLLRHRLAVLLGQAPGSLELAEDAELVAVPPLPAAGLPVEWLRRRPDVQEAFLRLQAADARLASAVANQYPRIDLAASIESAASSPSNLFSSWLGSLAANIAAPIFDGGRRRAQVEQSEAARAALLQDYGQTMLIALREVEDALVAERRDRELLARLQRQAERAQQIVDQLQTRYLNGSADYLDILSALDSQQNVARNLLAARWAMVQNRIDLARAIAGGWNAQTQAAPLIDPDRNTP